MTDSNELKGVVDEIEKDQTELGADPVEGESTDWKAEAIRARGIAKRNATRAEKLKKLVGETRVEAPAEKKEVSKTKGFDYAEKGYMRSAGIKPDEYDLVAQYTDNGKSLDDVLDETTTVGKLFQAELKEKRDFKASKDAIPTGSKRAAPTTRDSVEYWIAKGELPPRDQSELRSKVVRARIDAEKRKSPFSSNPIV